MVDLRPYEKLHAIQMLRSIVRRWWRVELAFADATGYVVDHADGRLAPPNNEYCRLALLAKEGFRRCNEEVVRVRDAARAATLPGSGRPRRSVVHSCYLGFDLVGCPIVFGGELAGLLFVGGSLRRPLELTAERELVHKLVTIGAHAPRAPSQHASNIPLLAGVELDQLCDLLEYGVDEIEQFHASVERRERELESQQVAVGERYRFDAIIGTSRPMQSVFRLLEKIIESESTVLIHGESGTGKELVARAIHFNGPRGNRAFVVQNCSAFNDNLLESALFGHGKGSFTGAIKDQKGLFEVADGGTFFLDEIGDMSPALQVKLLRVLQEGTFTPVGDTEPRHTDVRVIAASHKDLRALVKAGQFREDLFYRINVIQVDVPALRERIDDLDLLVEHFLKKHFHRRPALPGRKARERAPRLSTAAKDAMRAHAWPGNIRELENEIERLLVLGADLEELPAELLSPMVRESAASARPVAPKGHVNSVDGTLRGAVEHVERDLIREGLIRRHWNKSLLAKDLGISRSALIAKVARYRLEKPEKPENK